MADNEPMVRLKGCTNKSRGLVEIANQRFPDRSVKKNLISLPGIVGSQKKSSNETVLLSTENKCSSCWEG